VVMSLDGRTSVICFIGAGTTVVMSLGGRTSEICFIETGTTAVVSLSEETSASVISFIGAVTAMKESGVSNLCAHVNLLRDSSSLSELSSLVNKLNSFRFVSPEPLREGPDFLDDRMIGEEGSNPVLDIFADGEGGISLLLGII